MDEAEKEKLKGVLLSGVPYDGSIGNKKLRESFIAEAAGAGYIVDETIFETLKSDLVAGGVLVRGKGRGGSVRRAEGGGDGPVLTVQSAPDESKEPGAAPRRKAASRKKKSGRRSGSETTIASYAHDDKRRNNPEVGMVNQANDPDKGTDRWCYDPHIDPSLQFDFGRAQVEKLIDDALESGDAEVMREALAELRRYSAPYLNWTGKAERTTFDVDTVSLHVHERIAPATILAAVRKRMKEAKSDASRQQDMFVAPFENLPLRDAIDFYKYDKDWANRLIAGDSLLVMNSLLQKEGMAGRVQMIYIDPPYGIKYGSNFQPFVNKRDVKDRSDEDLTREPEMIKAFRDTWELGIHSYLTYLRDRLLLARELLNESGSVFVQISDENLHHVRELMDEIFGSDNFCSLITFVRTSGQSSPSATTNVIASISDYLLWYAKDTKHVNFRRQYAEKSASNLENQYTWTRNESAQYAKIAAEELSSF